jgi:DNA-binding NarL/FixJ family response regulator
MIRILLVDDHPVVRAGYVRLIAQDEKFQVIADVGSADAAYEAFVEFSPDITVTDLSMPGVGGLGLLQKILMRQADAKLLVCSMHDSPQLIQRVFQTGAKGFVSKNALPEILLHALHEVAAGRLFNSESTTEYSLEVTFKEELQRLSSLTVREYEILRMLVQGHSVAECAKLMNLSQKTISNHQTAVKDKLQVQTLAALVHFAQRHGVIGGGGF